MLFATFLYTINIYIYLKLAKVGIKLFAQIFTKKSASNSLLWRTYCPKRSTKVRIYCTKYP